VAELLAFEFALKLDREYETRDAALAALDRWLVERERTAFNPSRREAVREAARLARAEIEGIWERRKHRGET
jgi:hypothetical protein